MRARTTPWLAGALLVAAAGLAALSCRRRPPPRDPRGERDVPHGARFRDGAVSPRAAPREGGSLVVQLDADPPTLDPLLEHDLFTTFLAVGPIYETLLVEDDAGSFSPGLATAWRSDGDRALLLTLRPGVAWHDGRAFTVADVVATIDHLADPGVSADRRADFHDLLAVTVEAGDLVRLAFRRPAPLVLQALAHLPILPAHLLGPRGTDPLTRAYPRSPVGTGPFRLVAWRTGDAIVLRRNPRYWGVPAPLDEVIFRPVRDREAALELARRHELDLVWRLGTPQLARAQIDPALDGTTIVPWHLPAYGFIVWNTRRPGLADARVRRALTLLTDRRRYLEVAFAGRARAVSGPYPVDSPSYDRTVEPWPYDPPRARALLDEAGVVDRDGDGLREIDGHPLRIRFLYSAGSKPVEPLVTMLAEDLARVGIGLDAAPAEWATLLDRLRRHDFDAAALQWTMLPVQDNYALFHSSQAEGGQNYGAFADRRADALLETLHVTLPGPARVELDHRLHRLLHELQPYTFLGSPEVDSLVGPGVEGFAPSGAVGLGLARIWRSAPPRPGAP